MPAALASAEARYPETASLLGTHLRRLDPRPRKSPDLASEDRAILLASMSAVDAVVIFDEPTPLDLVLAIRPDVMVKGNDYANSAIAGAAEVESWGGRVVTLPLIEGRSTSGIIERILANGHAS